MSQSAQANLTVGIVTYNSQEDIDNCLNRLKSQTYLSFEIVILDNASSDNTVAHLADKWSQYRLIRRTTNIGFGNGHNQIIASTSTDYYLALNPDVVLSDTYIEEVISTIESDAAIGWVAGKLYFVEPGTSAGNPEIHTRLYSAGHAVTRDGFTYNLGYNTLDNSAFQMQREVFGANAAAPLYRRTMLTSIQFEENEFFDKSIFLYYEDADLDWRARLLGWKCMFTPRAVAYHVAGQSGGLSMPRVKNNLTAIRYYSIFKHAFLIDLLSFNIPAFILHMLVMSISEPGRAVATISFITGHLLEIGRKRKWIANHRKISRKELHHWFEWSAQQQGSKSSGYLARFWQGKIVRHKKNR